MSAFADPVCPLLAQSLVEAGDSLDTAVHRGGTYICMEGPQFSTRAESLLYRSWGADIIGMTNLQEAKLAREAEICFATLAMATDYDCWNTEAGDVVIEEVLAILNKNVVTAPAHCPGHRPAAVSRAGVRLRDCAHQCDHHRPGDDSRNGQKRT